MKTKVLIGIGVALTTIGIAFLLSITTPTRHQLENPYGGY